MALIEFKNKPDTETPINSGNLNFNFKEVMNLIYPINSIIIKSDNADYSDFLGFTWERTLVGRVAVGIDSSDSDFNVIGETGGEKEHTLTTNEMPSHGHDIYVDKNTGVTGQSSMYPLNYIQSPSNYIDKNVCSKSGGGQSHNNLQPYEVVAFWKRIA